MIVASPRIPPELNLIVSPPLDPAITLEKVEAHRVSWAGGQSSRASLDSVRLKDPDLTSAKLRDGGWADVEIVAGMLAGANLGGSSMRRIKISDVRASGIVLSETQGKDIYVANSKFDLANFRFAVWESVSFERCDFTDADFAGAHLKNAIFINCDLTRCDFSGAMMKDIDLRSSKLDALKGLTGLKGATIDTGQLIGLATTLASEIGINIGDSAPVEHDSNGSGKVKARHPRLHGNSNP